jgi:ribosomal protein S12 methylthiotransferase
VDGAAANALPGAVPGPVKQKRRERFMQLQAKVSAGRLARKVGRTLTVLVDEVGPEGALARSSADAPEIDGVVHVGPAPGLRAGEFAKVRITRADEHDLWATLDEP